jgi:hypothetical protein
MARTKNPKNYSREYGAVLLRAYNEGEVTVNLPSWHEGRKMQSKIYAFMEGVKHALDDPQSMVYFEAAYQVSLSLSGSPKVPGPVVLRIYNKENDSSAVILREVLGMKTVKEEGEESKARMEASGLMSAIEGKQEEKPFDPMLTFIPMRPPSTMRILDNPETSEEAKSKIEAYGGGRKT